ncbi:MAG TPA: hypothetical protein VIM42_03650 [Clostridium sp.]
MNKNDLEEPKELDKQLDANRGATLKSKGALSCEQAAAADDFSYGTSDSNMSNMTGSLNHATIDEIKKERSATDKGTAKN